MKAKGNSKSLFRRDRYAESLSWPLFSQKIPKEEKHLSD
jgi:hypothetical protein